MIAPGWVPCRGWCSQPLCIYAYSYMLEKMRLVFLFLEKTDLLLTRGAAPKDMKSINGRYLGNR